MITAPKGEFSSEYIRLISPTYQIFSRSVPSGISKPYVILNSVSSVQLDTKDTEGYEISVQLLIVTAYRGDKEIHEMVSNIQKAVMIGRVSTNVVLTDFNIENTEVTRNENAGKIEYMDTQEINNHVLIFKHRISQKT